MFDAMIPINAAFLQFGKPAVIETEANRAVTVMDANPDDITGFGETSILSDTRVLKIRASELGAIAKNSLIVVGADRLVVTSDYRFTDAERKVAILNTAPENL